ncbi:MAG: ArsR family transcriptional regulator [Saprospiraceae bacterium]|nr:ArsR family transcriptional regulator [Saprospiraceae bacterium]
MSYPSIACYPERFLEVGKLSNTLRSPARIQILKDLKAGPKSLAQMMVNHEVSRAALCQHLKFLIEADLVSFVDHNGAAIYSFNKRNAPFWYLHALIDAWQKD